MNPHDNRPTIVAWPASGADPNMVYYMPARVPSDQGPLQRLQTYARPCGVWVHLIAWEGTPAGEGGELRPFTGKFEEYWAQPREPINWEPKFPFTAWEAVASYGGPPMARGQGRQFWGPGVPPFMTSFPGF